MASPAAPSGESTCKRKCVQRRAGKNLGFLKKFYVFMFFMFLCFLCFNVSTVARGTLDTEIRPRRRPII